MFRLNIQRTTIYNEGKPRKMDICTRCLRTLHKEARLA